MLPNCLINLATSQVVKASKGIVNITLPIEIVKRLIIKTIWKEYHDLGYLVLNDVLLEEEMATLDPWFEHFIAGKEMHQMGKDFCDMSQPYGTPFEEFKLVNAMLPSKYKPEFANNIFQQISQNIADQLYRRGQAAIDYEQFLAKRHASRPRILA